MEVIQFDLFFKKICHGLQWKNKRGKKASLKPIKVIIAKGLISFIIIIAILVEISITEGLLKKTLHTGFGENVEGKKVKLTNTALNNWKSSRNYK